MPEFHPNQELLLRGLRAPLPVTPNSRLVLTQVFRSALRQAGAPLELIEPAAVTGGGLVHAFLELVLALNRLISDPRPVLGEAVRKATWACRDILGAGESAYVLRQAAETGAEPAAPEADFQRAKNLMEPLERRFDELGLPVHMDPGRFGVLQVHLDEVYDEAARQLQRFYRAVEDPGSPARFRAFTRGLSSTVGEIIPDHILATGSGPGRERTGLLDLLPELEREFS